ncbi:MAG: UDP-4-amino-4,6-dideoxy-N-acetyl-beta-L-altrosamine N-acetyltransferase, partial [Pseudomonadota bacterium]|nr:UDP-4-amino-4,6-dideoxy-N-acetyl-beta-L-altrosamine N-acetyltransferase [Pseudomonadota bacterium]
QHDCDLLLDANLPLTKNPYRGKLPPRCRLLVGPRYALLRPGFATVAADRRKRTSLQNPPRVFVCFGGSDPHDMTLRAAEALADMTKSLAADIVVGYGYGKKTALAKICERKGWKLFIDHPHPETVMAEADIAIGAGGTMTWERCAMGLPSIVISIADNQRHTCEALAKHGIIHYLGCHDSVDADSLRAAVVALIENQPRRQGMSAAARCLVDMGGTDRIISAMRQDQSPESALPPFFLRPLQRGDSALLLEGRNADHVRGFMLTNHIISKEEHQHWMAQKLASEEPSYFVFMQENKPIGVVGLVHFEKKTMSGEWGFYLWETGTPKGAGTHMLRAFLDEMFLRRNLRTLRAQVINSNAKSLYLHHKLGFSEEKLAKKDNAENVTMFTISSRDWRAKRGLLMPKIGLLPEVNTSMHACRDDPAATKKVAINQSGYLPWKGYFDIISRVDEFILLDDVQYPKNSWCNRNQIKTPAGLQWLTVPILTGGKFNQLICDAQVASDNWAEKHWKSIQASYAKAEFFHVYEGAFQRAFAAASLESSLSRINRLFIDLICGILGIKTRITSSADFGVTEGKNERIIHLLKSSGAETYLARPGSKDYMAIAGDDYAAAGIDIFYMDYADYPEYPQLHEKFEHNVSIIDLIFNCGPNARNYLHSGFTFESRP